MNPYSKEREKEKNENDEYKIEMRSQHMESLHTLGFAGVVLVLTIVLVTVSATSAPMLIYDESEVYSCPEDYAKEAAWEQPEREAFTAMQDKRYNKDFLTGAPTEDLFYDPLKCKPFYWDTTEPIWYGRVENLVPQNQNLVIYGFVHSADAREKDMLGKEFRVSYSLHVRGKKADAEEWHYFEASHNTVVTQCDGSYDLCTYFPVGFVAFLDFDMYDVMIEIPPLNDDMLDKLNWVNVDFHLAYLSPEYTYQQLFLKLVFVVIAALACVVYFIKLLRMATSKRADLAQFPFETLCLCFLLFLLIWFNDPTYYSHVSGGGSFMSFTMGAFGTATFIAGLLIFWLRDLARHRNP